MDKEILQVYVKCGFSYLKEIWYYVKELGVFKMKDRKRVDYVFILVENESS